MKISVRQYLDLELPEESVEEVFRKHLDELCGGEMDSSGRFFNWEERGHGNTVRCYSDKKPTKLQLAAINLRFVMRRHAPKDEE